MAKVKIFHNGVLVHATTFLTKADADLYVDNACDKATDKGIGFYAIISVVNQYDRFNQVQAMIVE